MPPKVSIVILTYNGRHHLETFLPSVITHTPEWAEVVIVDNASTDDTVDWLERKYPVIRLIKFEENYGFAGGYAQALKTINSDYYYLLNSDVEVSPTFLEPMVRFLDENPDYAATQPKILSYKNKNFFEHAGASGGFMDKNCYPFCRGRIFDTVERDQGQYDDEIDIFWASGAALLIRSKDYHKVGGLDADFFAHMEEIDLCWRLHLIGKRIRVCPESVIYHLGGGTLAYNNPQKTFLNFRNNLWMMEKNLPDSCRQKTISYRLILDGIAGVKYVLSGELKNCNAIIKAHRAYYREKKKLRKKREDFYSSQDIVEDNNLSGWIKIDSIKEYFIKGKKTFTDIVKKK